MAHFARVGRESLYAMQPPVQFGEDNQLLQDNSGQSNTMKSRQSTRKHWKKSNAPKNSKNRNWQDGDVCADPADTTRGNTIVPIDPGTHLAPSSLHLAAPSTPAPSATPPSNTNQTIRQGDTRHEQGRQPSSSMQTVKTSAYVPPHLRTKKGGNGFTPMVAHSPEESAATASADAEPTHAGLATSRLDINPTSEQLQAPPSPPLSVVVHNQASQQKQSAPVLDAEAQMNAAWGDYVPVPEPPPKPKNGRNGRWGSPTRKGRHVWPKNRDMKAVTVDEDYNGEDGGWGVENKSDSNGDPDYDVKKLVDWNGDWLPPNPDWHSRLGFTDRHLGENIEKWINGHDESCTDNLAYMLALPEYINLDNHEIAPRNWVPTIIEGIAPQSFWQIFPHRAPEALSDIDITERIPFWEEYLPDSDFLKPLEHPPDSILDPTDEGNRTLGAERSAEQTLKFIADKNLAREKRRRQKLNRPVVVSEPPPCSPGYRPTSNVYFRPVVAADAQGIQELYNHYVKNTISAPEFEPRSIKEIVDRIRTITNEGLPYIVAVHKGLRQNSLQPKGPQNYVSEPIVGIAFIDDFCDRGSIYRFTFELEFYVHPDFVRQNIAKCLLDRLLEMVNTSYPARGGYPWINNGEYLKHGSGRVVKMINCYIPHESGDDMVWMSEFLKKFRFRKAGHMFKMGHKLGKVVDVTVYQHETAENIDPRVRPLHPL